jgi:hypothetical protein
MRKITQFSKSLVAAGCLALGLGAMAMVVSPVAADETGWNRAGGNNYSTSAADQRQRGHSGNANAGHCYEGFYNETHCYTSRSRLRYGPLPRDFAFSQGLHILR